MTDCVDGFTEACQIAPVKTIKLEISVDDAAQILTGYEEKYSDKSAQRDALTEEMEALKKRIDNLRLQLEGEMPARAATGDNKSKIRDYLSRIDGNKGARAAKIAEVTGIGNSSVAFTLKNNREDFVADGKVWKLKQ